MILDGHKLAINKEAKLKIEVGKLKAKGIAPKLVVIVFKGDQAGQLYSRLKQEASLRVGIEFVKHDLDFYDKEKVLGVIAEANQDDKVHGIMIQHPGLRWAKGQSMEVKIFKEQWREMVKRVSLNKDVDGLRQDSEYQLATVKAVTELVKEKMPVREENKVVVVGARGFVGKRLVKRLTEERYTVEGIDKDDDLVLEGKEADVLISATGQNELIKESMVKEGAIVIDVGWPKGDVDFKEVCKKTSLITPVPGGIGPLTVVFLLENLVSSVYSN